MEPLLQPSAMPAQPMSTSEWNRFGRGLIPLLTLGGCVAITLVLTLAARELTASIDFAIREWIVLGVFIAGLAVAGLAYGMMLVRAFRRWRAQQRNEGGVPGKGMLWALIVTAFMVVLPIIIAALIPQHPAP